MNKGTKLLRQSKGTREIERNPLNLKRVRDFVARYSEDDEFSFFGPQEGEGNARAAATTMTLTPEGKTGGQAKKTRGRGNALGFAGRVASPSLPRAEAEAVSSLAEDAFPLIEFPESQQQKNGGAAAEEHAEEQRRFSFVTPTKPAAEEDASDEDLPLIQPIVFDREDSLEAATEENATPEEPRPTSVAVGQGEAFRILDDDFPEAEADPVSENLFPSTTARLEDDLESLASSPPVAPAEAETDIAFIADEAAARRENDTPSLQKHAARLRIKTVKPLRRAKKTGAWLGRRKTAVTAEAIDDDLLLLSDDDEAPDPSPSESPLPDAAARVAAADEVAPSAPPQAKSADRKRTRPNLVLDAASPPEAQEKQAVGAYAAPGPTEAAWSDAVNGGQSTPPEASGFDPCLVSFLAPDSFEAEQYRVLRYLVERLKGENGKSSIVAVTSPSVGDGKTTTAINLAGALAQAADARVLLVEADLRRPSVTERLGEKPAPDRGLVDAVTRPSRLRLQDVTVPYAALNLTVLPAGRPASSSYEVLKSPRLGALLEEARRAYDYIIIDTPPLVPVPDCRLIEKWVDGFFVVVAAHKTPRKLVREALSVIDERKMLGLVLNGDDPPVFGYTKYYGYYPHRGDTGDQGGGAL